MSICLRNRLLLSLAALGVGACSTVASYFPDKEKDYQYAREIAPLELPEDLKSGTSSFKPGIDAPDTPLSTVIGGASSIPWEPVKLLEYDGGASRLRIGEPISIAWRYVGKALSRHSIEILDRNELEQYYLVNYDPEGKKLEDNSFWDEMLFIFGDDPNQETELQIRFAEVQKNQTEVIIVNKDNKPQSEGIGVQLLQLLRDTINQDRSTPQN